MNGSVYVPYDEDRDVFIDTKKCGVTNVPFDVEIGTHDIDLGWPFDYTPTTQEIEVGPQNTPLAPLVVHFEAQS